MKKDRKDCMKEKNTRKARKPRKMKIPENNPKITKKNIKDMTKEELLEQNEYLRMENAYLKKLQALVQKRTKPQQEKK